jgi:N-acyl-D-amino-acid deacylase
MIWDLVINNGTVINGLGEKGKILNVGIKGNRIGIITPIQIFGRETIDATGLIVAPGFIDVHAHSDMSPFLGKEYISKIIQGVTTEINGNCGISPTPSSNENWKELKKYIEEDFLVYKEDFDYNRMNSIKKLIVETKQNNNRIWSKQEYLIGAGTLRIAVMGMEERKASVKEIKKMQDLLRREFQEGAIGISFGLIYPPGNFSHTEEIESLLEIVKEFDNIATFHMRDEGKDIFKSVEEVINFGKKTGAKVHISHLKIMDQSLWRTAHQLLEKIYMAQKDGVKISYDQYPYRATSTTLGVLLPKEEIEKKVYSRGGAEKIIIANTCSALRELEGKTLKVISELWNLPISECVIKILDISQGRTGAIYFSINEDDLLEILSTKDGIIASDGYAYPLEKKKELGIPHPRSFGTFPRFLKIVREQKNLSLEEAIAKITSIPAKIFNLSERGILRENSYADIVIFDYNCIADRADFINPYQKSIGINYVIVDGKRKIVDNNLEIC